MKCKEKRYFDSEYLYSPIQLSLKLTQILLFILIVIIAIVLHKIVNNKYAIIVIPIIFFTPEILFILYYKRKTPFEEQFTLEKKFIGNFYSTIRKWFHQDYNFLFYLVIYKEGLEIRVLLTSFFIPYEKITDIEFESKFSPSITIESSLKNVPSVISLGGVSEKAFPIIKRYLK